MSELSKEEYEKLVERWPQGVKILQTAISEIEKELRKSGTGADDAFALASIMLLREVFMRKTVAVAVASLREERESETGDLTQWLLREYEAWDKEAPE